MPLTALSQGSAADYERARSLRTKYAGNVFKDRIEPHWLAGDVRFWYRNDLAEGRREYIMVDAEKGVRKPAFDHAKLAASLTKALGKETSGVRLPLEKLSFSDDAANAWFEAGGKTWRLSLADYSLVEDKLPTTPTAPRRPEFPGRPRTGGGGFGPPAGAGDTSPDMKYQAFIKDSNLFLRKLDSKEEVPLTKDGTADHFYASPFYWSPDSKRLIAQRTRRGEEHKINIVDSSPRDQVQPKLLTLNYYKPGDRLPVTKPQMFDAVGQKPIAVSDKLFENPYDIRSMRWDRDSSRFTFVYNQRGHRVVRVIAVAADGSVSAIINEECKTFFDYAHKMYYQYLQESQEIIWMSERDGHNHLYLIDAKTGSVKCRITQGPWIVRSVERLDVEKREVWITAGGIHAAQDPYYVHYARASFDGSGPTLLTDGDGTHQIEYSPSRKYLIDSYSRVDMPPVTELRRVSDGKKVCNLEIADASALSATGRKTPERFVAKARDGTTDIYGIILRPSNFDPNKKYPVVEQIYAGPQGAFVPKGFRPLYGNAEIIAELGFIVVQIDGMGTSQRSKAFHDVCWKNLGDAGFPDRILWMKAAAAKYPQMDLTRVGIYGGSAGGQNALGGLERHPDFYKVAVADCGCHDNRMDKVWWNELWMSYPIGPQYAESSNVTHADKIKGKLLLIVGELDRNVDPASTMQVVNALIKANKDFDFLIVPGAGHGAAETPYGSRKRMDFLVRHLHGVEPRH
jgi:dipeptidyl aminopeptidase/acylaminoacyl peptidase